MRRAVSISRTECIFVSFSLTVVAIRNMPVYDEFAIDKDLIERYLI